MYEDMTIFSLMDLRLEGKIGRDPQCEATHLELDESHCCLVAES